MISFDINLLSTKIVRLKSVTTSLGGSITIIDEEKSTPAKEEQTRIEVPLAVARSFIMAYNKVTKYLKPVYVSLAMYGDMVVAMERHPLSSLGDLEEESITGETKLWEPAMVTNINGVIVPAAARHQWYFDGRFMYRFDPVDTTVAALNGKSLTSDGKMKKVNAQTIDLQNLRRVDDLVETERNCLAFVSSLGDVAISPPIWKDLEGVGRHQLSRQTTNEVDIDDDTEVGTVILRNLETPFDDINRMMAVNLNFVLKAGQQIGKMFGYEYVEPLQLSRLMVELHTVNLPKLPKQIKSTYDANMSFTHALAWLLGMSRKANTLETYVMMRSLMSYLTKKGIFRKDVFDAAAVYRDGMTSGHVEQKDAVELMKNLDLTHQTLAGMISNTRNQQENDNDE